MHFTFSFVISYESIFSFVVFQHLYGWRFLEYAVIIAGVSSYSSIFLFIYPRNAHFESLVTMDEQSQLIITVDLHIYLTFSVLQTFISRFMCLPYGLGFRFIGCVQ